MLFIRKRKKKKQITQSKTNLQDFRWTLYPEMTLYNKILEGLDMPEKVKTIIDNSEPIFMNINLRVKKKEETK